MTASYTFGDGDIAARRLALLYDAFEPEMRAFITASVTSRPERALDLGCGIGLTTRLVAELTGATRTLGVDVSEAFVARARATAGRSGIEFELGDLTSATLPGGPADVQFCHLLLTHLPEPIEAIARWTSRLAPDGVLLIDEVESISTAQPTLTRYLEMVSTLVQTTGGDLYIGPRLAAMSPPPGAAIVHNALREHRLTAAVAAGMFRLNLAAFRERPSMRERYGDELAATAPRLDALVEASDSTTITWQMRQMAIRAPGGN
jgi:SAM-dependent methyltransferase